MQTRYSRLANIEINKNYRKSVYYFFGTLTLALFVVFFGIPLASNVASILDKSKSNQITNTDKFAPPVPEIKAIPTHTKDGSITLSGNTEGSATVKINLNGEEKETDADDNGLFSINVNLKDGENEIYFTSTDQSGNSSEKTKIFKIIKDSTPPEIEITTPKDGDTFFGKKSKTITITGKTENNASLTINDRNEKVDQDGNFNVNFTLNDGTNDIVIKVKDEAGNETETSLTITFTS